MTDYQLPDGNGVDLLDQLRQRGFSGGAVMITAFGTAGLRRRAEQAGFARILDKPFADHTLTLAIKQVLA